MESCSGQKAPQCRSAPACCIILLGALPPEPLRPSCSHCKPTRCLVQRNMYHAYHTLPSNTPAIARAVCPQAAAGVPHPLIHCMAPLHLAPHPCNRFRHPSQLPSLSSICFCMHGRLGFDPMSPTYRKCQIQGSRVAPGMHTDHPCSTQCQTGDMPMLTCVLRVGCARQGNQRCGQGVPPSACAD